MMRVFSVKTFILKALGTSTRGARTLTMKLASVTAIVDARHAVSCGSVESRISDGTELLPANESRNRLKKRSGNEDTGIA